MGSEERAEAEAGATVSTEVQTPTIVEVAQPPAHPVMPENGPRLSAAGIIHGVTCHYPSIIEFQVEGPRKTVTVYNNDFYKINLTASGFTPQGTINPCSDFEGRTVSIQYVKSSDTTVDGQVIAVEMRK